MRLPVERIDVDQIKAQMTFRHQPLSEDEPLEVRGWYVDGDFLCVPRQFGLRVCNQHQIEYEDHTSAGAEVTFPKVPTPRDYQAETLQQILEEFEEYYDVVFRAHTGWGKTIGSLIVAANLGRSTLIIVDQENLKDQWIEVLTDPKLFGFAREDVGEVQGPTCSYEGKAVTIAMLQTLYQKRYEPEFYEAFGTVIYDEFHVFGGPQFSKVLYQFPAMYRLPVSATPRRKDGMQRALTANMGAVRVSADKEHEESAVYILRNDTVYSFYGNVSKMTGRIISEVIDDGNRNMLLIDAIMHLYDTGRDVLVLSERIEHLKSLADMLYYIGVPEDEVGMYTGYQHVWGLMKDPTPARLPKGLHRWKGPDGETQYADYTPIKFGRKEKKTPKATFDRIKNECSIVLATYGKFAKGVDIPRLAGGVDATPRSQAEQAQGRILRTARDKLKPIWITVVDEHNYRFLFALTQRAKDYDINNSQFYEWDGEEETTPCQLESLLKGSYARTAELKKRKNQYNKSTGRWELVAAAQASRAEQQTKIDEIQSMIGKTIGKPRRPTSPSEVVAAKLPPRVRRSRS